MVLILFKGLIYKNLKLFKCSFVDVHLYSNSLSTIATISSKIMLELFPACHSCSKHFTLSRISLGVFGKKVVEIPETMLAGDLIKLLSDLSQVFYYLELFHRNTFPWRIQTINFYSIN